MGVSPEPGQTVHQAGDQPGAKQAAEDGEDPARGGDLTFDISHNLRISYIKVI